MKTFLKRQKSLSFVKYFCFNFRLRFDILTKLKHENIFSVVLSF